MLSSCNSCYSHDPGRYGRLEDVIPHSIGITVCQYDEDGDNFNTTLRLPLKTKEEIILWLEEFQAVSKTTLRKSKTFPHAGGKLLYKCIYRCQHNTNQKNPVTNRKQSSKNTNCPFQLSVHLRRTDVKQRKNAKDVHFNVPACIVIKFHHNHDLDSVQVLKKRDVGPDVRAKFEKLFEVGHSPSSALETHKYDLQIEEGPDFAQKVNDRRYCPDIQWCFRVYYKMFESEYGPMSSVEMALSLQQRVDQFNGELGDGTVAFLAVDDYIVIAVCTPLMKRVHQLVADSSHTVYVESSSCLDSKNECRVYMLMTSCGEVAVCGVPLGVVITTSESEHSILQGFQLLKTLLPDDAFHGRSDSGPVMLLTDDCSSLRSCLSKVFLLSTVLLSQFHVLWDVWRWLWASKNGIALFHRSWLYDLVDRAVRAETCEALADAFTQIYGDPVAQSYEKFMVYMSQLLDRSTLWASCYRTTENSQPGRLGSADIISRAAALQKDKIFNRLKSFSPIQLVDFTVSRLERYFVRRLQTVCRSQQDAFRRCRRLNHNFPKDTRVTLENVWSVSNNDVIVPTEIPIGARRTEFYAVNTTLWVCTCPVGSTGAPCKHQWAAATKYPSALADNDCVVEPLPVEYRQQMYYIATGFGDSLPQCWIDSAKDILETFQAVPQYVENPGNYCDELMIADVVRTLKSEPYDELDKSLKGLIAEDSNDDDGGDDDDVARTIERFSAFSDEMIEHMSLDPDTYLEPVKSFLSSYESITTNAGLVSALRCFGEYSRAASAVIAGRKRKAISQSQRMMESVVKVEKRQARRKLNAAHT